jgi:hypothetical protein
MAAARSRYRAHHVELPHERFISDALKSRDTRKLTIGRDLLLDALALVDARIHERPASRTSALAALLHAEIDGVEAARDAAALCSLIDNIEALHAHVYAALKHARTDDETGNAWPGDALDARAADTKDGQQ